MSIRIYNAVPDATLLFSALLAWIAHVTAPIAHIIPFPFTLIGWLVAVVGVIIAVRTLAMLRSHGGSTDVTGVSSRFVKVGLYAYSRNPFYLLYILVALGVAVGFGSLAAFAAPVLCFAVLNFIIVPIEERSLERSFGKEYTTYKRSVRRWL